MRLGRQLLVAACCAAGLTAHAGTVTVDFEPPTYNPGPITNGEGGWQVTNPNWDQAVITGANVISGQQSWRMSNRVASGSFGDQPFSPAVSDAAGETATNNFFGASLKFSPLVSNAAGDGVVLSIDNGTGQRGNWMGIQNTATHGWVLGVYDYDTNQAPGSEFVYHEIAQLTAGVVYDLGFDMLFNTGADNDVWNVYLNGASVYTGRGWEEFYREGGPAYGPSPVTFDRLLFRAGGSSVDGAQGVVFDDVSYQTNAVPEPSSLALGGIAAGLCLGGWWRQRRRSSVA